MFNHEALKTLLDNRGVRQAELARIACIPRSTLSRCVTGMVEPRMDTVKAIADALGVSMEFFILKETPPEPPKLKLCHCPNCGVNLEGLKQLVGKR